MILATQFTEFYIVAIVAVLIIAVALLIYYIVTGRKAKNEIPISPNFETKNVEQKVPQIVQNEVVQEKKPEVVKETIPEVKPIDENAGQKAIEEAKTDNSIQTLLNQMQQDLDKNNNEDYAESIARYEDDEEANAIISYTELMKYKENHEKDIVLEDKGLDEIKEVIKEKEVVNPKEEVKKFKRSEFISPIFGYNEDANVTYREIKRPPRKEPKPIEKSDEWESDRMLRDLEDDAAEVIEIEEKKEKSEEIDKNKNFLDALVDFRNKLN